MTGVGSGPMARASLLAVTLVGVAAFGWPFIADPGSSTVAHANDAPWLFALLVPLVLLVVVAELSSGHDGSGVDSKTVAMLGVMTAVAAAMRPLGTGIVGFEPIFFVLLIGGRALGPAFGFALGSLSLFASALLTGGVGPWLPFQMLGAAWFACGAGLLPRSVVGKREIVMLMAYGALGAVAYGFLLNLWFWPWASFDPAGASQLGEVAGGATAGILFTPGAELGVNLLAWLKFSLLTSLGFDLPRAFVTAALVLALGRPALNALARATKRAAFDARPSFQSTAP